MTAQWVNVLYATRIRGARGQIPSSLTDPERFADKCVD